MSSHATPLSNRDLMRQTHAALQELKRAREQEHGSRAQWLEAQMNAALDILADRYARRV